MSLFNIKGKCPKCKYKIKLQEGNCPKCNYRISSWDLDIMLMGYLPDDQCT